MKKRLLRFFGRTEGRAAGPEWTGGLYTLPAEVREAGRPYQPEVLVWMGEDGALLGSRVGRPGELLAKASESLAEAMEAPLTGRPHAPARLRVASAALADALARGHPGIEVVRGVTPELDAFLEEMGEEIAGEVFHDGLPDLPPEAWASFHRATAALHRANPWEVVPGEEILLAVRIPRYRVEDWILSLVGPGEGNLGWLAFPSLDDMVSFVAVASERGDPADVPSHLGLTFDASRDAPESVRRQVDENGWELAHDGVYPWVMSWEAEKGPRATTGRDVALCEAIAWALSSATGDRATLAAWRRGEPAAHRVSVSTHDGEVEVSLTPVSAERAGALEAAMGARGVSTWGGTDTGGARRPRGAARRKKKARKAAGRARKKNR
jgi:hypothetical protein